MQDTRARMLGRTARWVAVGLVIALPAGADTDIADWTLSGSAELGGRVVTGDDWGSAKYEEYRDQRPGVFGEGNFLLEDPTQKYYFRGLLRDVGERDEHYSLEAGRWGRYRLELEYGELPHVYSNHAASRYHPGTNEQLRFLPNYGSVPLEFRLRTGGARLLYRPLEDWEFSATYDIQDRQGTKPFAINFGFSDPAVNVARPIDERIHEVNLAARWSRELWNVELGYMGSFFKNDLERLQIDTTPDGGQPGQISLAPDNSAHTFRLTGAASLPVDFPARLAATLAYSKRYQDENFLCHTIDTGIDAVAAGLNLARDRCPRRGLGGALDLPDDDLDGEVDTFLANFVLTARPHRRLNLTARYRLYEYDNDTPELTFPNHVSYDNSLATDPIRSVANEYQRQNASLDVSYRLLDSLTFRSRYTWERWARSSDRSVTRLDEHGARFALDYRPGSTVQLRTSYEFKVRRGNDYDPFARLEKLDLTSLTDAQKAAEVFPELTKYDQADRMSDRVQLLALIAPREDMSFSFTGSYGHTDYDSSDYGLLDDVRYSMGGEVSYWPVSWLGLSSWYSFENIKYRQKSRTRSVSGGLPVEGDDWKSLPEDVVHNLGFRADVKLIPDRLDLEVSYNRQHAVGKTRSTGDAAGAVNFPRLKDVLQSADAVLVYQLRENLAIKTGYRWERFDLKNFRIDDLQPGGDQVIFLGEQIDDYTAHIIELSAIWTF